MTLRILLLLGAASSAAAQSIPVEFFMTYQFAPAESSMLQRATHSTSISVSPTTFDELVDELDTKKDEAPVFRQLLKQLVEKHQLPNRLFPEVLVLQEGAAGPTRRFRYPSFGDGILLWDRQRVFFFEGQSAFDYVKRGTRGVTKLYGPGQRP